MTGDTTTPATLAGATWQQLRDLRNATVEDITKHVLAGALPDWRLDSGIDPNRRDVPCPMCGDETDWFNQFGVAQPDGPRVCTDCADDHMPANLGTVTEALSNIDHALRAAPAGLRTAVLGVVTTCVTTLVEAWADTTTDTP